MSFSALAQEKEKKQENSESDTESVQADTLQSENTYFNEYTHETIVQDKDNYKLPPLTGNDPNKAALLSAAIPGLGQAYNKSYWKIPIIYGGGAVIGYLIAWNDQRYQLYRNALIDVSNGDIDPSNPLHNQTEDRLNRLVDNARRSRDYAVIFMALLYALNIVEAYVDANLQQFDISDNLSMKVAPAINSRSAMPIGHNSEMQTVGLSLKLNFK
ncbi:DUF5683 domain-containing protein [Aureibacter tunicatorum]|uniref:DUF5683 domain-containing protein n=1 Tax=Aureibacter tunicatorum TaxID=866807 RepID=A0AAE3XNN9_9BACT|nr:DUF5683 domain-containing protein [Aureibacter tunicatorum]MDR6239840.1 hypothetical protein [Aureibacter tunicatorum]